LPGWGNLVGSGLSLGLSMPPLTIMPFESYFSNPPGSQIGPGYLVGPYPFGGAEFGLALGLGLGMNFQPFQRYISPSPQSYLLPPGWESQLGPFSDYDIAMWRLSQYPQVQLPKNLPNLLNEPGFLDTIPPWLLHPGKFDIPPGGFFPRGGSIQILPNGGFPPKGGTVIMIR
jgi:hypothetical protein